MRLWIRLSIVPSRGLHPGGRNRHRRDGGSALRALLGSMSIRTKIFFGCISLTLVTILVGVLAQGAQKQLSETALGIYDKRLHLDELSALGAVDRSRRLGATSPWAQPAMPSPSISSNPSQDALEVARERAMTPRGEDCAKRLQAEVLDLQARFRDGAGAPARSQFRVVEQDLRHGGRHLRRRWAPPAPIDRRPGSADAVRDLRGDGRVGRHGLRHHPIGSAGRSCLRSGMP